MAKFAAFYDTRRSFIEYTGYTRPLSYEEWANEPEVFKAALLFVQFYNEILSAWSKADSRDFGDDAEGVSTVLQYLQKQVSQTVYYQKEDLSKKANAEFRRNYPEKVVELERRIIDEDPKKFAPNYIYKVAYNCLYCICGHDRQRDKDRMEFETSSIIVKDCTELDLFDTISDPHGSASDVFESSSLEKEFWAVIEDEGLSAEKVMRYLLSGNVSDLRAASARSVTADIDPLAKVSVSLKEVDSIIQRLRERFSELSTNSAVGSYIASFARNLA